jgi:hypothetical protein
LFFRSRATGLTLQLEADNDEGPGVTVQVVWISSLAESTGCSR